MLQIDNEKKKAPIGFKQKNKRAVLNTPSPNEETLLRQIQTMNEPYKSYAAFLYLFGSRVSEAIGAPPKKERIGTKTIYTKVGEEYKYINYPVYGSKEILPQTTPIRKRDLAIDNEGILYVENIPVLKQPGRPLDTKYVDSIADNEQPFINILYDYLETKEPDDILWEFTRYRFYKELVKHTDIYPHKLRSLRATKDTVNYNLDIPDLQKKYGWTDIRTPLKYVKLAKTDVIAKIKNKRKQSI